MTTLEQELMEKISRLHEDKQRLILEYVETIAPKSYTLDELSAMSPEDRRKAVASSFAAADDEVELFEAFGEADFYDE